MKFLAIDYGLKRTGLAVSDPGGSMAFPRATLTMRAKDVFFAELLAHITEEKIEAVVIGLPLYSDGSDSETTRMVRNMAARLQRKTPLPVFFMPETLSSHQAELWLAAAGKKGQQAKDIVDQAAAVAILDSFLALDENKRIPVGG